MVLVKPGPPGAYHIVSIEGLEKTGKTHLASQAPGKVAILSSEGGWDGVIQKQPGWEEKFLTADYYAPVDLSADEAMREGDKDRASQLADRQAEHVNETLWKPFVADHRQAMADPSVRTVVWDLADEFNEYLRLANFGKIEKNPQIAYGPVNAEYKSLVRLAQHYRKNLILLHKVGTEYKTVMDPQSGKEKSVATNKLVRRGNKSIGFLVQSYVRTDYDEVNKVFRVQIQRARLNPAANGEVLENPDWLTLMQFLAPDVPMEAWE